MTLSSKSKPAYWRIVPKRSAPDRFRRRFTSLDEAEMVLGAMTGRRSYKLAAFNRTGKLLDHLPWSESPWGAVEVDYDKP